MNIRPATINDLITLQSISRITFAESFAHLNSDVNMRKYLDSNLSTDQLRSELLNTDSSFYLAEENGGTIGYLKLNDCGTQRDVNGTQSIEIERIYLLKSFHGLGVGKKMLDFAFSIARDRQKEVVWLGVWEKNHRAIAFYRKHGFVPYGTHIFRLGDEDQQDILMRISMR